MSLLKELNPKNMLGAINITLLTELKKVNQIFIP